MKVWDFIKSYKKSVVGILSAMVLAVGGGVGVGIALNQKPQQSTEIVAEDVETHLTPRNQGNWSDHAASSFAGGSGTQASPYLISTAAELAYLMTGVNGASYSNFQNKYYTLTSDIDLLDYYWTPIGDYNSGNNRFYGYFDGDGHKISGMLIDGNFEYAGLFGYIASGEIKNVGIEDSEILINILSSGSGNVYVGGIAGDSLATTTGCYNAGNLMVNCGSSVQQMSIKQNAVYPMYGDKYSYYLYIGGIVGYGSTIANCYNTGLVRGNVTLSEYVTSYVGGIIGSSSSTVTNCYNTGYVNLTTISESHIGGIAGFASGFTNCYNTGLVNVASSSDYIYAGGIAGYSSNMIRNCYNTEDVVAASTMSYPTIYSGGIVGYIDNSSVTNCYSVSDVSVSYNESGSGVSGKKAKLIATNSVHTMAGGGGFAIIYSGGIVGFNRSTTSNCYYDSDVYSGYASGSVNYGTFTASGGISGLTEIMKDPESYGSSSFGTYTNQNNVTASATWSSSYPWDFANTFMIKSWYNGGLPMFQYESSNFWEDVDTSNVSFSGNGTEASPYLISTPEQFTMVMQEVNNRTLADLDPNTQYPYYKYYKLTADIDLSGKLWTPIGWDFDFLTFVMMTQGHSSQPNDELFHFFYGSFDGDGHKITGANVDGSFMFAAVFAGVLGSMNFENGALIQAAVIKNLGLEDSTINSDEFLYCGGLIAGVIAAQVDRCYSTIDIDVSSEISYSDRWGIEFDSYIGGVVAGMQYSDITNCYNTGNIIGDGYDTLDVGGVAGGTISGSIQNSFNTGNITCARTGGHGLKYGEAGGIVGGTVGTTVSNCYNTGNITSTSDYEVSVGGIVGEPSANGSISKCYNTGAISGNSISSSYSVYVGGIVGQAGDGSITDTFSTGTVSATGGNNQFVSGLVGGVNSGNITLSNSYFDSSAYSGNAVDTTGTGTRTITSTGKVSNLANYMYFERNFTGTSIYTTAEGSTAAKYTADGSSTQVAATWTSGWDFTNTWEMAYELNGYPTFKWYVSKFELWRKVDTSNVSFGGGNGSSEATAYEISNANQLVKLMQGVNGSSYSDYQNKYYKLTADIDLSGKLWTPIGDYNTWDNCFVGNFDGNGHKITGMNLQGDFKYAGLFGGYARSTISNLGIENSKISINGLGATVYCIGGICGAGTGTIINCYNSGAINVTGRKTCNVGGIEGGYDYLSVTVSNCYNTGSINVVCQGNSCYIGGIKGYRYSSYTPTDCYNTGSINVKYTGSRNVYVGGIIAECYGITNCHNRGSINVVSTNESATCYAGGISGYGSNLTNCSNAGEISVTAATKNVGGLIGRVSLNVSTNYINSYNIGNITVSPAGNSIVGGLFGQVSSVQISECFASCDISAQDGPIGGIVGKISDTSCTLNISKCFYEGSITTQTTSTSNSNAVGGLAGYGNCKSVGSSITDCYAKATINAPNLSTITYIKPWIGYLDSAYKPKTISDYYYNVTINSKKGEGAYYEYDKDGTFSGEVWYYNPNLNEGAPILREFYWVAESTEPQDDVKDVFGSWRIITLDNQSATSAGTASVTALKNKPLPIIPKVPSKTGYYFAGYYTETNGAGTQYYKANGMPVISEYPFDSNLTLYAYWIQQGISYTDTVNGLSYVSGRSGDSAGLLVSALSSAKSSLVDVVIPETYEGLQVVGIASNGFQSCSNLTSVTIPKSVSSIGDYAFSSCSNLTSVTIPKSVSSIGDYAFSSCSNLTSITIGNSVTSIGSNAFFYCRSLTSITIPNSVTSISDSAFQNCSKLTSITVDSENLNYSAENGVLFNKNKTSLIYCGGGKTGIYNIPNSVTRIGSYAFYCSNLTSIEIPNSVTSIGSYAFSSCSKLTTITIPNSVTSIGSNVFQGCNNLTSITVDSENLNYSAENGVLFNKDKTTLIYCLQSKTGIYSIPSSVTSIGSSAFSSCSKLTSITIPNSVTSIGSTAFQSCSSLTSIEVPNSVTSIGGSAFYGCSKLNSITIGNRVTSIGNSAFSSCSKLNAVYIKSGTIYSGLSSATVYGNLINWSGVIYVDQSVVDSGSYTAGSYLTSNYTQNGTVTYEGTTYYRYIRNNTYKVNLVLNGGSLAVSEIYVLDNNSNFTTVPVPTYEGHTFKGWYTTSTFTTQLTNTSGTLKSNVSGFTATSATQWNLSGEVTIYAKWS